MYTFDQYFDSQSRTLGQQKSRYIFSSTSLAHFV